MNLGRVTAPPGARRTGWLALACAVCLGAVPALAQGPEAPVLGFRDTAGISDRSQGFSEPSGLARASDGGGYWSVSDDTGMIFYLSPTGELVADRAIPVATGGFEGVVEDAARSRLLAVREETAEIVSIPLDGGAISLHPLPRMAGFDAISDLFGAVGSNHGLEGITLDSVTGEVVVIQENRPRLLVRITPDLSEILGATELTRAIGFSCAGVADRALDVSDLTHDPDRGVFWILSDTGSCAFLFDPALGQATSLPLPGSADTPAKRPKNPEGLALSRDGRDLRIVTDDGKSSRLITLSVD
jgi:uncharacterized protein YjiK